MAPADERVPPEHPFGIRARYSDMTYELHVVTRHLWSIDGTWQLCRALADYRIPLPLFGTREEELAWIQARAGQAPADRLVIDRLRVGSPMELSLVVQGGLTAITVTAMCILFWILKNPSAVGGCIPRAVASWRTNWEAAELAKRQRQAVTNREPTPEIADSRADSKQQVREDGKLPIQEGLQPLRERVVPVRRHNELNAFEEPPVNDVIKLADSLAEMPPKKVEMLGGGEPPEDIRQIVGDEAADRLELEG